MTSTPEISIVIPTYNGGTSLMALLESIAGQTLDPARYEVIVVDDCSTDGTWEALARYSHDATRAVRVLRTPTNSGGPAAPRNLGWRRSKAEYIAFLDDDCVPRPDWLTAGLSQMKRDPKVGVMQGQTLTPPEIDLYQLDRYFVYRLITEPSPWFEAVNIFYRRAALEEVGGFNETIVTWGEDTDLGWSVVEKGWARAFSKNATVTHRVERRDWRWWVRFGLLERNVVLVAARHPRFREEAFWRPWAVRRDDAAFAAAILASAAAVAWTPALIATLPYLWWRRPKVRQGRIARQSLEILSADMARLAGHISGSVRSRTLVI
jgi:GT2 family glycosyltransferase